jgi:hypothetical protein
MDGLQVFHEFFNCCVGQWQSERTYHYLIHQEIERSQTTFQVETISSDIKTKVLNDNQFAMPDHLDGLPGFQLVFHTVSEKGEVVDQALNMLFVPKDEPSLTTDVTDQAVTMIEGSYLRDRAYEESRPIVSDFRFNPITRELLMTTHYTHVVSVDSITLVNPKLRIRRILNYQRPADGQPLSNVMLVGFGVEQKH